MVHPSVDPLRVREIDIDSECPFDQQQSTTSNNRLFSKEDSNHELMEAALAARNSRVLAGSGSTFHFSDWRYERASFASSASSKRKRDDCQSSLSSSGTGLLNGHGRDPRRQTQAQQQQQPAEQEEELESRAIDSMYLHSSFVKQQRADNSTTQGSTTLNAPAPDVFVRGSLCGRDIEVNEPAGGMQDSSTRRYKGRIRTWPGICLLLCLVLVAVVGTTYFGVQYHRNAKSRADVAEKNIFKSKRIIGGKSNDTKNDIISDDGVVGNPKRYPPSKCELPMYWSKNGRLVAAASNGTEVPIAIKGVNWFGMETGEALPFGLWENSDNGTDAYQIALFLSKNNFNAVRLPLMAAWILDATKKPNINMLNRQANRAINTTNYLSTLRSVIKVLQFRHIGVVLSMHTLTNDDNGKLWYNSAIPEAKFLQAIDLLTSHLCSDEYWNVLGIDVKNEPYKATWGDGTATDFRDGAKRIANRMLDGCPNWLGFVEGINAERQVTIDGQVFEYFDWYGGGLQDVKKFPLEFKIKNKLVYAPHYYTPAVYPQKYFYGGGQRGPGDTLQGFVELDDRTLRRRVQATMHDMFGYLASASGPALLLGEFGGLYTSDRHPKWTARRCTDFSIQQAMQPNWSGGFMWSLNPESKYQYNPADAGGPEATFAEGLLLDDWLRANEVYLKSLAAFDAMPTLRKFPCFNKPTTAKASSNSRDDDQQEYY